VGDHSLEDCPIILEKIMSKKSVNHLCSVPKPDELNVKNFRVITIHGVKTGNDANPPRKIINNTKQNDYPNPHKQRELVNDATIKFYKI